MSTREEIRARRKEEKRKAKLGLLVTQDVEMENPVVASEGKKKSKRDSTVDELIVTPVGDLDTSHVEKKKKRKHRDGENEAEDDTKKEKRSKKRKHTADDDSTIPSVEVIAPFIEDKKSRKKDKMMNVDATMAGDHSSKAVEGLEQKKKKKKSKNATDSGITDSESTEKKSKKEKVKSSTASTDSFVPHDFPDPTRDTTLPGASVKSLAYAHHYADRHNPNRKSSSEEWKFSKARQNWLTRHIWYEDAVPEKYVDLVVHYLKSVQGGARDAIVKGCQILLNPLPTTTTTITSDAASSANPPTSDAATSPRKVTFSEPAVTPAEDAPIDPAEAHRLEVRRTRAKILQDALSVP